jgi:hypothetical protein
VSKTAKKPPKSVKNHKKVSKRVKKPKTHKKVSKITPKIPQNTAKTAKEKRTDRRRKPPKWQFRPHWERKF